jgi:hypothetical protein
MQHAYHVVDVGSNVMLLNHIVGAVYDLFSSCNVRIRIRRGTREEFSVSTMMRKRGRKVMVEGRDRGRLVKGKDLGRGKDILGGRGPRGLWAGRTLWIEDQELRILDMQSGI